MKLLAFAAVAQVVNSQFTSFSFGTSNYQPASSGFSNNLGSFQSPFASNAGFGQTPSHAYGVQGYNDVQGTVMYSGVRNGAPIRTTSFSVPMYPTRQAQIPVGPPPSRSSPFSSSYVYPPGTIASYASSAALYPSGTSSSSQVSSQITSSYIPPVFSSDSKPANFVSNSLASMSKPEPQQMYKPTFTALAPSKNQMKIDDVGNEKIFNPLKVRRYNLVLSAADKAFLDNDPSKEEYVPCDIITDYGTDEATTFYGAGCRYKGSLGSLMLCIDPETRRPNGGCRKLSWKVDANKFRDDKQKINGQKKLIFNGMAVDTSLMSERVAYAAFAENNIPAPRSAHAELWVNGVHSGLFTTVESVDDRFGREFFGDDANKGEGAIYKDLWIMPDHIDKIKSHHSDGKKEHKFVEKVIEEIMAVSERDAPAVLEKYFDTKSIVDITALNTLIGQTDDWRIRHNFHWYVREGHDGTKKLVLIPWDFDRLNDGNSRDVRAALGNWYSIDQAAECTYLYQSPVEKAAGYPANIREFQAKTYEQYPPRYGVPIQCDKISQVFAVALRDRVKRRIKELDREMPASVLENKIKYIAYQIKAVVKRDPDWPEEELWTESYTEFKDFLRESRRQALQQASRYDPPVHFGPVTTRVDAKDLGFEMSSFSSYVPSTASTFQSSSLGSSFGSSGTSWGSSGTSWGSSPTAFTSSFGQPTSTFGSSVTSFGSSSSFGSFGSPSAFGSFGRF